MLGPITVEISGGRDAELPAQLRKVLAVLALTRDVPLSGEQLVKRIWDGDPPRSATQMVRNQIRTLRQLFGDAMQHNRAGYRLAGAGLEIDAVRFRSLVYEGRRLRDAGRVAEAVGTWERGVALWRGPEALVDVQDVPDLQVAAVGLEELRFQAEELITEGHLALGSPEEALPVLQAMTARHPSRELPWLRLMAAQALIGRRVEASGDTYHRAHHHLVEQTGLDAPLLTRVHQALLNGIDGRDVIAMIMTGAR